MGAARQGHRHQASARLLLLPVGYSKLVPASPDWPQCRGAGEPGPSGGTRTRPCHRKLPGPLARQPLPLCSHLTLLGRGQDPAALPTHPSLQGTRLSAGVPPAVPEVCHAWVPFLTADCVRPGCIHTWDRVKGLAASLCPCLILSEPLPCTALGPGRGPSPSPTAISPFLSTGHSELDGIFKSKKKRSAGGEQDL